MEFLKLYDEENRDILYSMSWLNKNSIFDKSTGSFQEIDLFTFLENINNFNYDKDIFYDDIYYILEYTRDSIWHLINNINKEIKRDHKIVPVSQAKEFDKKTIIWLSRQDGRTVKEKLKNNKIKAVKRYSNVDTYENRVFKIFLKKLTLIEEKREKIQSNSDLITKIRRWLRGDDAKSIDEYGTIVYNNILLHHPHYSKIFKSYKWLNKLDEKVQKYQDLYPRLIMDILTFSILEKLQFKTNKLILPNNLEIKHDKFFISFSEKFLPEKVDLIENIKNLKIKTIEEVNFNNIINLEQSIINEQLNLKLNKNRRFAIKKDNIKEVFIDLFRLFPIAKIDNEIVNFPIALKQKIDNKIINANNTKIIDLNHELYTLPEILKTYDNNLMRYFLEDLKKYFEDRALNYIIPDYVNIFEFSQIKKTINGYFPKSRNIPKSILAGATYLFENKVEKNDTLLYIQRSYDNNLYVTPLLVRYDNSLKLITNGLYLEKHPTKKLKDETDLLNELKQYFSSDISQKLLSKFLQNGVKMIKKEQIAFYLNDEMIYLKNSKKLSNTKDLDRQTKIKKLFSSKKLFNKKIIEIKDENETNLKNYQKLLELEKDGYILWKEHLPRLAMGDMPLNGYFGEFVLVDDDSEVINGEIQIKNHFIIPANTKELSFPLLLGDENINYEAYITSNELPLKEPIECELKLTYNYEAETPYKLDFIALNNEIKPLKVSWRKIRYKEYNEVPIPAYPQKKNWNELQEFANLDGKKTDLLEWISRDLKRIIEIDEYIRNTKREEAYLSKNWKEDRNRKKFQEIDTNVGSIRIYHNTYIDKAKRITFNIEKKGIFYKATNIISDQEHIRFIKSMRFPLYTIWKDSNSLSDIDVPNSFRKLAKSAIDSAVNLIKNKDVERNLKKELFLFLSVINKDAPADIINIHINSFNDYETFRKYREIIPYAVGCLHNKKQFKLLKAILNLLKCSNEKQYSDSLKMLGIIVWRCKELILEINMKDIDLIINKLLDSLKLKISSKKELIVKNKIKPSVIGKLELLLALLRYREKKLILKPDEYITKEYIKIIDKISKMVIEDELIFKSRIQLNLEKPSNFTNTPDLLYTLRVYLSGDTNIANNIQVLGVSDD